jgi:FixJ family two-component response regulator
MSSAPLVLAIVDDDPSVRHSLSRLLGSYNFTVEVFESGEALLTRNTFDDIGCILLDIRMPGLDGLKLQQCLLSNNEVLPIVFLSGHGDIPMAVQAISAGAIDFLTKPADEMDLLEAVRKAFDRRRVMREEWEALNRARSRLAELTRREREVLEWVVSGAFNRQIAGHLGIAEKTVKVHRGRVMDKLGVSSIAELVRFCATLGVEPKKPPSSNNPL